MCRVGCRLDLVLCPCWQCLLQRRLPAQCCVAWHTMQVVAWGLAATGRGECWMRMAAGWFRFCLQRALFPCWQGADPGAPAWRAPHGPGSHPQRDRTGPGAHPHQRAQHLVRLGARLPQLPRGCACRCAGLQNTVLADFQFLRRVACGVQPPSLMSASAVAITAELYRQAFVNVCACACSSSSFGLFSTTEQSEHRYLRFYWDSGVLAPLIPSPSSPM